MCDSWTNTQTILPSSPPPPPLKLPPPQHHPNPPLPPQLSGIFSALSIALTKRCDNKNTPVVHFLSKKLHTVAVSKQPNSRRHQRSAMTNNSGTSLRQQDSQELLNAQLSSTGSTEEKKTLQAQRPRCQEEIKILTKKATDLTLNKRRGGGRGGEKKSSQPSARRSQNMAFRVRLLF